MVTGELRSKVDKIWEIFWTGGITNPLSVIEQFTYLLFIKGLDDKQTDLERNAEFLGIEVENIFSDEQQNYRWHKFKQLSALDMYEMVSKNVFPFIKKLHGDKESAFTKYMDDAIFMIPTPQMLEKIVTNIDQLPLSDGDTKGDLYEYLLSKVATAGTNGQFRTPRHIIKMMVELMQPTPTDIIIDIITTKTIQFNYPILKAS
jgi:type I restriction enzyme M protein